MARREPKQPRTLKVRITFESSRLSPEWMARAYAQVVPISRRPAPKASRSQQTGPAGHQQRVGRSEPS
jgi:hypothetical protein